MEHKQKTDSELVTLFNEYYKKCKNISKNISKNTQNKLLIFLEFYKYYILVMNRFAQEISRMQRNRSKPIIESREKIREGITKKKKEVDKILSELDDRNKILLVLAKKNTNTNKLPKNLANNIQLEYNAEQLSKNNVFSQTLELSELNALLLKKKVAELNKTENNRLILLKELYNKNELERLEQERLEQNLQKLQLTNNSSKKRPNAFVLNNTPQKYI